MLSRTWLCVLLAASAGAGCLEAPEAEHGTAEQDVTQETRPLGPEWRVSATNGEGTAWRTRTFDFSSWPRVRAPFGYGESWVTPISYGADASNKPPTVYAINTFYVADPARYRALRLDLTYDDGAVVYLNGTEVLRRSMPAGPVSYTTFAFGHEASRTYEAHSLDAHLGLLVPGENRIQIEIHQADRSSSDLVLGAQLVAQVEPAPLAPADGGIMRRDFWAFYDRGGDLGTAWRMPGFAEPWPADRGPLGYGESYIFSPVSYGPSASNKHITTYFRREVIVDDPAAVVAMTGELMYDDGAVVYLNGTRIASVAMPSGTVTASTLALGHEANNTYESFDWTASRHLLVPGVNVLAVEVHQQSASSSDLVFDASLTLQVGPPPEATQSIPPNATWWFWDRGGDLGTAWRDPAYADGAWPRGRGIFGYGEGYIDTRVSYGTSSSNKHLTTYFRTRFDADLSGGHTVTGLLAHVMYDDGAVVYLNGQEVARLAMPAGTVTASTRALGHESLEQYETVDLGAFAHLVRDGENVVAVEVHQAEPTSSDLVFDLALDVERAPVFTRYPGNPVVTVGDFEDQTTHWRADSVTSPNVVKLADGSYVMFFTGNDGAGPHYMIGRATSPDGIHWTIDDARPVHVGASGVRAVVHDGSQFLLYHDPFWDDGLELMTSPDGVTWTHHGVVHPEVITAAVIRAGGAYQMWSITDLGIQYSSSNDGVHWSLHGLVSGVTTDAGGLSVVFDGATYHMWFYDQGRFRYATSTDGRVWVRRGFSMVPGPDGAWDSGLLHIPFVMRDGGGWKMWYGATDFQATQIGYATFP